MVASLLLLLTSGVSDDRDVIQTALLSFFTPAEWHSADWKPKESVVLRTQFINKDRPEFSQEFKSMFDRCREAWKELSKAKEAEFSATRRERLTTLYNEANESYMGIQAAVGQITHGGTYTPPVIAPLPSFAWDKRIRVSDRSNRPGSSNDKSLEEWTVYADAARPCYSKDGNWAIVSFRIPWSIHSAKVWFLLERGASMWLVRSTSSVFWV